ncbi:unnamed protein product [Ixodes hexagonus]
MSSFMQRQFLPHALLCRLGGCFFIPNFWKPLEKAKVTWISVYTAYSAVLIAFSFSLDVLSIVQYSHLLSDFSHAFSPSLLLIVRTVVNFQVLLNAGTMTTGSIGLLEFFQKSTNFEKATGFSPAKRGIRSIWENRWSFTRRFLVVSGAVSTFVLYTLPVIVILKEMLPGNISFLAKLIAVLTGARFILHDALPYMVLRCCTAVLVEYLQAQRKMFERCCGFNCVRSETQLSQQLEVIRHNLGSIRDLKDSLNAIWQVPLAVTSAGILLVVCVACYAMFNDGFLGEQIPLHVSYSVYSALAFVDMACVSQALADEAQELKNASKMAFTFEATGGYMQQLRFLHETIDPDGMCLSGGGFFRLNKSLLVSMAGTMITYTVILSQTSDGLTNKTAPTNSTQIG